MSDDVLKLIPMCPNYVLSKDILGQAVKLAREFFPQAEDVSARVTEKTSFIDQGQNWERVRCPRCGTVIADSWWKKAMDAAHESGFVDLDARVPCCGTTISLNDLCYEWPAGFARTVIEIRNPGKELAVQERKELEKVFGYKLREIWAHY